MVLDTTDQQIKLESMEFTHVGPHPSTFGDGFEFCFHGSRRVPTYLIAANILNCLLYDMDFILLSIYLKDHQHNVC